MRIKIQQRLSMSICRNTIIRVPFTETPKTQYSTEITISQLPSKCKINQCYHKYCRRERVILERRDRVSTSTYRPKTQQTSTLNLEQMRLF